MYGMGNGIDVFNHFITAMTIWEFRAKYIFE